MRHFSYLTTLALLAAVPLLGGSPEDAGSSVASVYALQCARCHGPERLGGEGPALLPGNLKRLRKSKAKDVILNGRAATQMPPFKGILSTVMVDQLVDKIYEPLPRQPRWGMEEIKASHVMHHPPGSLPNKPVFDADLQNLFVVVETGDHHVTLLDGDDFKPIHRFPTRYALHGGPKYSRNGRFVHFASRDGWISRYDIWNLKVTAEVRAGVNTRNAAVSFDDRFVAVGNYLPHGVAIFNAEDLSPVTIIPTLGEDGVSSRVSAVYTAPPRGSFIVALKDLPEVWEIPYEGVVNGDFKPRRIKLDSYLDDFFFDRDYQYVIGAARPAGSNASKAMNGQVVDLEKGTQVSVIDLPGMPHLGSGISWDYEGRRVLATPNLKDGAIHIIDMRDWSVITRIPTMGPGFFMRSHAKSRYAWVDVFFGPHKDKVHIIDKQTLSIVKTLQPVPGKTAAHVEFTKDGRYALLSIWDLDGALVIYDAETLEEVRRLPMKKPSGKYNVYNKTHYEEGTSH